MIKRLGSKKGSSGKSTGDESTTSALDRSISMPNMDWDAPEKSLRIDTKPPAIPTYKASDPIQGDMAISQSASESSSSSDEDIIVNSRSYFDTCPITTDCIGIIQSSSGGSPVCKLRPSSPWRSRSTTDYFPLGQSVSYLPFSFADLSTEVKLFYMFLQKVHDPQDELHNTCYLDRDGFFHCGGRLTPIFMSLDVYAEIDRVEDSQFTVKAPVLSDVYFEDRLQLHIGRVTIRIERKSSDLRDNQSGQEILLRVLIVDAALFAAWAKRAAQADAYQQSADTSTQSFTAPMKSKGGKEKEKEREKTPKNQRVSEAKKKQVDDAPEVNSGFTSLSRQNSMESDSSETGMRKSEKKATNSYDRMTSMSRQSSQDDSLESKTVLTSSSRLPNTWETNSSPVMPPRGQPRINQESSSSSTTSSSSSSSTAEEMNQHRLNQPSFQVSSTSNPKARTYQNTDFVPNPRKNVLSHSNDARQLVRVPKVPMQATVGQSMLVVCISSLVVYFVFSAMWQAFVNTLPSSWQ